jgi:hypothetical protein
MAKISGLTPLAGINEDADTKYQSALERIQAALTARENPSIDPVMLAMAQGFLTPGKTGSFAEGLGGAAGNVIPVVAQKQKDAMDNAQMRLQLAQAEREQARKTQGLQYLNDRDQPTASPTGEAPTSGATPKGDDSGLAVKTSKGMLTPRQISKIMFINPELGKVLEAEYKMELDATSVQAGGSYNKRTDTYKPFGGKTTVQRFAPADPATGRKAMNIDMSEQDAIEYDNARASGNYKALSQLIDRYTTFPTPPVVAPITGATPSEAKSTEVTPVGRPVSMPLGALNPTELKQQQELDLASQKAENEALSKGRADRTSAKINAGNDAGSRRQTAQVIQDLFQGEGMDQVTGVLERPGFLSGVLKLAEDGINLGRGFSISVPQVRDIFTANKINLPKIAGETRQQYDQRVDTVISKTQQALSLFAQVTFGLRSLAAGQGSISNFEQVIFDRMGPSVRDTYQTIMAKTKHMEERAKFDETLKNALVDGNMSFDKFSRTPEYTDLVKNYDTAIRGIYTNVKFPDPVKPTSPSTKKSSSSSKVSPDAKARLDAELN